MLENKYILANAQGFKMEEYTAGYSAEKKLRTKL